MATADKVSAYDGLVVPLTTTRSNISSQDDFELPITIASTLTTPAYKGAGAGEASASEVIPTGATHRTEVTGGAGASGQQPRHVPRWTSPVKGVGSVNADSVTGTPGFTGQGIRRCKITSITVIRSAGAVAFSFEIYSASGRTAIALVSSSASGGTNRIDVIPDPSLDYRDESTTTKGADGKLYCRLIPGGGASDYQVKVEVEPL